MSNNEQNNGAKEKNAPRVVIGIDRTMTPSELRELLPSQTAQEECGSKPLFMITKRKPVHPRNGHTDCSSDKYIAGKLAEYAVQAGSMEIGAKGVEGNPLG